ncbi:MAG: flippase-like domain-containing protein [Bacteroidales bacterium]|nr:flippase-like domain-containing protein [Bacteroidales bacterium]
MTALPIDELPRKNRTATIIKFVLFLGLGIFIIWLSLRGLTHEERIQIMNSFRIANYNWVILTIFLGIGSHVIRSLRWMLFFSPMGYHPTFKNTFFAVMVGYFANLAFPRLGEVIRCGVLARIEKIPFNKSFGTVITERAIDMICFFLLFILMISTQVGTINDYLNTHVYPQLNAKFGNLHYSRMLFLTLAMIIVLMVGIYFIARKKIKQTAIFQKVKSLILGFWEGLKSLVQMRHPGLFVFYSVSIWILYFLMLYVCFFCFAETSGLSPGAGLSSLVLGSVGIMITPGGIGLYPAIIQETLLLYGVTRTTGLALGWIAWAAQTGMILILGGISLILLSFNKQSNGKT